MSLSDYSYGNNHMAYLYTIKDDSSNDILAYHVSGSIKLDIAVTTINKLLAQYKGHLHENAFIYSDQGVYYTNPKFQKLLKDNNFFIVSLTQRSI